MLINLHTHDPETKTGTISVVNVYPEQSIPEKGFYSTGIHPWRIRKDHTAAELAVISQRLGDKNCVAVGECGLDKRIEMPLAAQLPVLERQLLLADAFRKPVIVHCVAAFQEVIEIKKRLNLSVPLIIHGFSKNLQLAESLLQQGFFLSFGKHLLDNPGLSAVFIHIPEDRFFLETDKPGESIHRIYEAAASARNIPLEQLTEMMQRNFNFVFPKNKI